jgi:hypothetical protein
MSDPRYKLISCEIFYREMCAAVARAPHQVDLEFLPKGLHDIGSAKMSARLQEAVDAVDAARYQAVLLGYALCGTGLVGLAARAIPLVLPRAHDCITLFLGSKERYLDYFQNTPGVYFKTSGWIERGETAGRLSQLSFGTGGVGYSWADLVEKYGEENAQYLWEAMVPNYRQFTYIEMGVEPDDRFERLTRERAEERGWKFEKLQGDMRLIDKLVAGVWDEGEFLVVPPGKRIVARYDEGIVGVE